MTIRIEIKVGKKKYKLYDYEAAQLFNKLRNYFESVGAFSEGGDLEHCTGEKREIGFHGGDEK